MITREFSLLCGEDAGEMLATLYTFLQALTYAGRRRWEVGYPGYTLLTIDERRMLDLIAAAQSSDMSRFETYLHALARPTMGPTVGIAARALGTALNEHDLRLPLPVPSFVLGYCADGLTPA